MNYFERTMKMAKDLTVLKDRYEAIHDRFLEWENSCYTKVGNYNINHYTDRYLLPNIEHEDTIDVLEGLLDIYQGSWETLSAHDDVDFWALNFWIADWYCHGDDYKDRINLLLRKRRDYGERPFKVSGTLGIMARSADKVCRAQNILMMRQLTIKDEQIEDTFVDLYNYSLIATDLIMKDV